MIARCCGCGSGARRATTRKTFRACGGLPLFDDAPVTDHGFDPPWRGGARVRSPGGSPTTRSARARARARARRAGGRAGRRPAGDRPGARTHVHARAHQLAALDSESHGHDVVTVMPVLCEQAQKISAPAAGRASSCSASHGACGAPAPSYRCASAQSPRSRRRACFLVQNPHFSDPPRPKVVAFGDHGTQSSSLSLA